MTLALLALILLGRDQILRTEVLAFVVVWAFDLCDWHKDSLKSTWLLSWPRRAAQIVDGLLLLFDPP